MKSPPDKISQENTFSQFRESTLLEGKKELELLCLSREETEKFIKTLYFISDHLISQYLERK